MIYDEIAFRRWLESMVSWEWTHGHLGAHRTPTSDERLYTYQVADLITLRARTYVTEAQVPELIPTVPLWRIRDLRFRAVGPRFLKPAPRSVIYIAKDTEGWADGVSDFPDPIQDNLDGARQPHMPPKQYAPSESRNNTRGALVGDRAGDAP